MDLLGKLIAEVVGFWHDETKNRPIDLELAVEIHDGILFLKMVENRRSALIREVKQFFSIKTKILRSELHISFMFGKKLQFTCLRIQQIHI